MKKGKDTTHRDEDEADNDDCECPVCGVNFLDDENKHWIGCDGCLHWWHDSCLHLTEIPLEFYCSNCQ